MKKNRLIAFALSVSLLLGASACGKPAKTVSELIAEENAILDQHQELWTTALNSLDKDKLSQSTQSTNYADVLDLAIKNVKDQLSDEDYKTLTDDAAKVRKLEDQLQELPPEEGTTTPASGAFPAFEGKDLDGNAVDSSLFADNAFTVVNFWFSGCKQCVAELGDLDKLNQTPSRLRAARLSASIRKRSMTMRMPLLPLNRFCRPREHPTATLPLHPAARQASLH